MGLLWWWRCCRGDAAAVAPRGGAPYGGAAVVVLPRWCCRGTPTPQIQFRTKLCHIRASFFLRLMPRVRTRASHKSWVFVQVLQGLAAERKMIIMLEQMTRSYKQIIIMVSRSDTTENSALLLLPLPSLRSSTNCQGILSEVNIVKVMLT